MLSSVVILAAFGAPWKGLQVDPWGENSLRVRFNLVSDAPAYNGPGALSPAAPAGSIAGAVSASSSSWTSGELTLALNLQTSTFALSRAGGKVPLATMTLGQPTGNLRASRLAMGVQNKTSLTLTSKGANASYFGFGEHENSRLDQVGLTYDMEQCIEYSKSRGGEICLPWVVVADDCGSVTKAAQYGIFWNLGSFGSVALGAAGARQDLVWEGYNLDQVDIFITTYSEASVKAGGAATMSEIMSHYVDAVGHAPVLPHWASGYWHSKNRYKSQAEVVDTYAIFEKNFSIPISVFIIDYFNWAVMGNLTFDPAHFPDPKVMTDTLKNSTVQETRVMVSTWPFSQGASKTYAPLSEQGFAIFNGSSGKGPTDSIDWPDSVCGTPCRLYDPTNSEAREWWWGNVKEGYYDYGVELFWLDAAEPEQLGGSPPGSAFSIGSFEREGMLFPKYHTQTYSDGLTSAGSDGMVLSRSAWAGMQSNRAILWNGDTYSTYAYLEKAVYAIQNVQLSGIAWWTTDIGGYQAGNPKSPAFRELIVRWFQFGVTNPIFRQHGLRDTEPWLLGTAAFASVRKVMAMRETLRAYVEGELAETARSGLPLNRPLFYDFPADSAVWDADVWDQFTFGRKYMAAPIYAAGAMSRSVYFPLGCDWVHYFTGEKFAGGTRATVAGPIDEWPLFSRA